MTKSLFLDPRRGALEEAVQRAETELSDAREHGDAERIQRAETRLSNAVERLDSYLCRGKGMNAGRA